MQREDAMSDKMKTKANVRTSDGIAIIDIEGDLTPDAREAVEAAHREVVDAGIDRLVITFRPDAYINSGGIAIIINIAIAGTKAGQRIRLVQPSEHFQKIFTMVGLRQYVDIYTKEDDALSGF